MTELRRKDRKLSDEEARSILAHAEYGYLSTADRDGTPYGVPMSYCVLEGNIYFHCAVEGQKLENLQQNSAVSFCAVGRTQLMPEKFGTQYESVIAAGEAQEVFDAEKQAALECLVKKYSPDHIESGAQYIEALTHKTRVFKIVVSAVSGKSRKK